MALLAYFCNVKRCTIILLLAVFAVVGLATAVRAAEEEHSVRRDTARARQALTLQKAHREVPFQTGRLATSTFPVEMKVKGSSLCITSKYSQLLPIYTRGGTFYMAMRLNKGLNWLNGLPRGRYIINNQSVSIP